MSLHPVKFRVPNQLQALSAVDVPRTRVWQNGRESAGIPKMFGGDELLAS